MVIKGRSRSNGAQLAEYLLQSKENDRAYVLDIRGTANDNNLKKSLLEMSLSSELTKRGKLGLYHAQVNPAIGEDQPMSAEDWLKAADILEENLGLAGQKRAIVLHEKNGRLHGHVVWERYDHDTGKLRADGKNYEKHDKARAEIERTLGHELTPQKAQRELTDKERLMQLWQDHPDGREFIVAAEREGYQVAQGNDRRPFRVVTPDGQSLDLTRQLDGIKTKEVRDKLQPIRDDIPTEAEALKMIKAEREPEQQQSDNLDELSDWQDLAMGMINRFKDKEKNQKFSYSFTVSQTLNYSYDMLYSDILKQEDAALNQLQQDYYTATQEIKQMEGYHFDRHKFDGELERLKAGHERKVKETEAEFEQKKAEFLREDAPPLPREIDDQRQSDKKQDLSDRQDIALAMIKEVRDKRESSNDPKGEPSASYGIPKEEYDKIVERVEDAMYLSDGLTGQDLTDWINGQIQHQVQKYKQGRGHSI
jgi:hypothetical protein